MNSTTQSKLSSPSEIDDDKASIPVASSVAAPQTQSQTKTNEEPVYIEGIKLQLVFLALSLVTFLMPLDIAIIATVCDSHIPPRA